MVPRVKYNNPLGTQKDFDKRVGSRGPPGKLKNLKTEHITQLVTAVTEYLPIRRKTLSSQSIMYPIYLYLCIQ